MYAEESQVTSYSAGSSSGDTRGWALALIDSYDLALRTHFVFLPMPLQLSAKPNSIFELDYEQLEALKEKFWARVEKTNACLIWIGKKSKGYGCVDSKSEQGQKIRLSAHRVSYELLVGKISEGLELDHLCRNH